MTAPDNNDAAQVRELLNAPAAEVRARKRAEVAPLAAQQRIAELEEREHDRRMDDMEASTRGD